MWGSNNSTFISYMYLCMRLDNLRIVLSTAASSNEVVIKRLLRDSSYVGIVRVPLFFLHIREHLAVPSRRLVDLELPFSQLFELLNSFLKFLPDLFKLIDLSVRGLKIASQESLVDVVAPRRVRSRNLGIDAFDSFEGLRNLHLNLLEHALLLLLENSADPKHRAE